MELHSAREWLSQLLETSGLEVPDGRPLYAYRCSASQFDSLRELLSKKNPGRELSGPVAQTFAIYAAEWWRRNYSGGAWSWSPILDSLHWNVAIQDLYEPLRTAWRLFFIKPVILSGRVQYLGTCACQGGVPLHFVSNSTSNVRSYLRALVNEYRKFRLAVEDGYTLAEPLKNRLPRTLQQDAVYRLCSDLVEQVWTLRKEASRGSDPIIALDTKDPDWRSRIPVDLEDETARQLIRTLLTEASQASADTTPDFRVTRFLLSEGSDYKFALELGIPKQLPISHLSKQFEISQNALPSRFQLRLHSETPYVIAQARVSGDDVVFSQISQGLDVLTRLAGAEVVLSLFAGRQLGRLVTPSGGLKPSENPWVFVDREGDSGRLDLIGEGTLRTRYPSVVVASLEEQTLEPIGESSIEDWGCQPIVGRKIASIDGPVCVATTDGLVVIRPQSESEEVPEHRLVGARCFDLQCSKPVFYGTPSLVEAEGEGTPKLVPPGELLWAEEGTSGWKPRPQSSGVWRLKRTKAGELVFSSRVVILDADFEVRILPGSDQQRGSVVVRSAEPVTLSCLTEGVQVKEASNSYFARFDLQTSEQPPSRVDLAMRWDNGTSIQFVVPFPGRGGRISHPASRDANQTRALCIGDLYGWRATVLSPDASEKFFLEGELKAPGLSRRVQRVAYFRVELPALMPGLNELPLVEVQDRLSELLALSTQLDARVCVRIVDAIGRELTSTDVRRFRCEILEENDLFWLSENISESSALSVEAVSLSEPHLGRIRLQPLFSEGVVRGWGAPQELQDGASWLVFARDEERYVARPRPYSTLISETNPVEFESTKLNEAARITDKDQRTIAISRILVEMVGSTDSADSWADNWRFLSDLLLAFKGLPPSSSSMIECLSNNPTALVRLLLRSDESIRSLIWNLEKEFPFSWLLIPARIWFTEFSKALMRILHELEKLGTLSSQECLALAVSQCRSVATEGADYHSGLRILSEILDEAVEPGSSRLLRYLSGGANWPKVVKKIDGYYQDLLRADRTLPSGVDRSDWEASTDLAKQKPWSAIWINCEGTPYRRPISDAPMGAALAVASGATVRPLLVQSLKSLRRFDETWFDNAYVLSLAMILGYDKRLLRDG